jgi:hypothetical protein
VKDRGDQLLGAIFDVTNPHEGWRTARKAKSMRPRVLSGIFGRVDGNLMRRRRLELGQTFGERGIEEGSVSAGLETIRRATGKQFPDVRRQTLGGILWSHSAPVAG